MNKFKRNLIFEGSNTGGRGSSEMQSFVNSILHQYTLQTGSLTLPIKSSTLAEIQNAKIIYYQDSKNWISSLMPIGNGFVINVNKAFPKNRRRFAVCHEIAHTFFFDTKSKPLRRLKNAQPNYKKEELLCFWAAREMLVPSSLYESKVDKIEREKIYSFEGINELAKDFEVSPDIIAWRLTHDLGLLGNDWIILWYWNSKINAKVSPKPLYPKHISILISEYMKSKIIEDIRSTVSESRLKETPVEKESKVGKKKTLRYKVKTEKVNRPRLYAISWISLISV